MKRTTPNWLASTLIAVGGFVFGFTFFNEYFGLAIAAVAFSIAAYGSSFMKEKKKKEVKGWVEIK